MNKVFLWYYFIHYRKTTEMCNTVFVCFRLPPSRRSALASCWMQQHDLLGMYSDFAGALQSWHRRCGMDASQAVSRVVRRSAGKQMAKGSNLLRRSFRWPPFIQTMDLHTRPWLKRCGHHRVPGETKRSWDLRGGRWSWTLKLAQKRSWVGRWSWAEQVGRLLLRAVQVVRQQRCNGHCLCDSVQAQQLKQQLRGAQVTGQWLGDTALTLPLFWRRSTVYPVFFGRFPRWSLHCRPLPTLSPSLISHLASVDVKQQWRRRRNVAVWAILSQRSLLSSKISG